MVSYLPKIHHGAIFSVSSSNPSCCLSVHNQNLMGKPPFIASHTYIGFYDTESKKANQPGD